MINVDTVYQKILALTNKEQRGYITPQEFNLFARKAQLEIFDGYFHDAKTAYHKTETDMTHADDMDILSEKLQPHKTRVDLTPILLDDGVTYSSEVTLPNNMYYINNISRSEGEVTEMSEKEVLYTENNPLTKATINRSVYVRRNPTKSIQLYPTPLEETTYTVEYYKQPKSPQWAYVVVRGRALYNQALSRDFTLHESEEEMLVSRILMLSGVSIQKPEISQAGAGDGGGIKQSQID
tara:strand:+ start:163 stop:876 length:714 start_codon:yes stop_codon:yes gene_type:complete